MTSTRSERTMTGGVRVDVLEDGAVWRLVLDTPKANVLDAAKIAALTAAFARARDARELKALIVEGEGPHFSFGASVEEHLPERCAQMLRDFHAMFLTLLEAGVPALAAVRGQCLGGALELASSCHRVFAAPDARLGQPEIRLGVFAPLASLTLAERVGRAHAEDLCLTGRSVTADEALRMGLVDEVVDDPGSAASAWIREHLLPRSAASLRHAVRAVRFGLAERLRRELPLLEAMYLDELMATRDAVEGLNAFLEKREPTWSNR